MLPLILPVGALLAGVALLLLGSGLLNTLLALRGGLEGYSDSLLGLIMSGYFVGFFIGTFAALPLIQRIGHIRTFAFCAALASCSTLLHSLLIDPWSWMALRVLTGTALVILYTVIESWLNSQTPPAQRGRVFAVYMVVTLLALALAQQLLRFGTPATFTLFVVAAILTTLSLMPVIWTRLPQPEVGRVTRMGLRDLYRRAPVAVTAGFLSGLAMGAFWGMGALYARRIGMDDNGVAMFMSCAIIGGALFQFPIGRYSDSHDRRRVLLVIALVAAVLAIVLALVAAHIVTTLLVVALYGGLVFALYPVAVAHLVDHLEPGSLLAGGSGLLLLHGVGAALGPALAGQLMDLFGSGALPFYFAAVLLALAGYAAHGLRERASAEPADHPAHFVPMVRTTPTVLEMLPDEPATAPLKPSEP